MKQKKKRHGEVVFSLFFLFPFTKFESRITRTCTSRRPALYEIRVRALTLENKFENKKKNARAKDVFIVSACTRCTRRFWPTANRLRVVLCGVVAHILYI